MPHTFFRSRRVIKTDSFTASFCWMAVSLMILALWLGSPTGLSPDETMSDAVVTTTTGAGVIASALTMQPVVVAGITGISSPTGLSPEETMGDAVVTTTTSAGVFASALTTKPADGAHIVPANPTGIY